MTAISWKAGVSGNWGATKYWTPDQVPGSADTVTIAAGGTYTVSITADEAADQLTLNAAGATLSENGAFTLAVGTSFALSAGTLALAGGATVTAVTLTDGKAGVITSSGGTIGAALTSQGQIDVSAGTLSLTGSSTLGGTLAGAGALWAQGNAILDAGSSLGVATLAVSDVFTVGGNFAYAGALELLGGTLNTGTSTFTLSGNANDFFDGGVIAGAGTLITEGTTALDGLAVQNGGRVTNSGTDTVTSAYLTLGVSGANTATFLNANGAVFALEGDVGVTAGAGATIFTNAGLFEKVAGNSVSDVDTGFTNTGTVLVDSGTLDFTGAASLGGTLTGAGAAEFDGAATLSAGAVLTVGTLAVAGTLGVGAGLAYGGALVLEGGTLALGANDFALTGNAGDALAGGLVTGVGTLLLSGTTVLDGLRIDNGASLSNAGTATLTDADLTLGATAANTASLINAAGGVLSLEGDAGIALGSGVAGFTNAGTLQKTGGAGQSSIEVGFKNVAGGTVLVSSGTLAFLGSATIAGALAGSCTAVFAATAQIDTGATLAVKTLVATSTLTLGAGLAYAGALDLYGATVALGTNSFTLTGNAGDSFESGVFAGAGTLLIKGTTALDGITIGNGVTLSNTGTATLATSDAIFGYSGANTATLVNATGAVFDLRNDIGIDIGRGSAAIANAGLFEKTGGVDTSFINPAMVSTGTIAVTSGTLAFDGTAKLSGTLSGGGEVDFFGAAQIASGTTLDIGTLAVFSTLALGAGETYAGALQLLGGTISLAGNEAGLVGSVGDNFIGGLITGPGTFTASGTTTLDGLTIDNGTSFANTGTAIIDDDYLLLGDSGTGVSALQNAAGATLDIDGDNGVATLAGSATITNAGVFEKTAGTLTSLIQPGFSNTGTVLGASGTLDMAGAFQSSGSVTAGDGATVMLTGAVANVASGTLTGGTWSAVSVGDGATLCFGNAPVTVDAATIVLSGGGATIMAGSATAQGSLVALETELGSISAGGILQVLGGRDYSTSLAFTDAGTIVLGGGRFAPASLSVSAAAVVTGFGTIAGAVSDAGNLAAAGGTLVLGMVSGNGTLSAGIGAVLDLTAGGTLGETVNGAGTLQLDSASYTLGRSLGVASVLVDAGATLAGSGILQGALTNNGGVVVASGILTLQQALAGAGSLTVGTGADVDLLDGGTLNGAVQVNGTMSVSGLLSLLGAVTGAGTISAATGAEIMLAGGGALSETITGPGTLAIAGAIAGAMAGGTVFTLAGETDSVADITLAAGSTLSGFGTLEGALTDDGTLTASGGKLLLGGGVSGDGVLQAASGAVLELTQGGALDNAVSGAGTLALGGAFTIGTGALTVAGISVLAGAALSGTGHLSATLADSGTVEATSGTLVLSGAVSGSGTLMAAAGATVTIAKSSSFGGKLTGAGTIALTATAELLGGAALAVGTFLEEASLTLASGEILAPGTGVFDMKTTRAGQTLTLTGEAGAKVENAGTFTASGPGISHVVAAVSNSALLDCTSGTFSLLGNVTNAGTISAIGGELIVRTDVQGTGVLDVGATSTLWLEAGAAATQTASFTVAGGTLELGSPADFLGHIAGFGLSDVIELAATTATTLSYAGGVLTVEDNTTPVATLHFNGAYTSGSFTLSSDGHGDALIGFAT
jgi:hypothetical protein